MLADKVGPGGVALAFSHQDEADNLGVSESHALELEQQLHDTVEAKPCQADSKLCENYTKVFHADKPRATGVSSLQLCFQIHDRQLTLRYLLQQRGSNSDRS